MGYRNGSRLRPFLVEYTLRCGIIGLPNVGKSTLFNALTASSVPAENYPFCTIDPHVGIVPLPDQRLNRLEEIFNPDSVTPATVEFTDIAGLVKGASRGEGLGNRFLGQIRQVEALVHVVRCFEDKNISHVDGGVDPVRDAETIETELLLADLETIEKRLRRAEKLAKTGDKKIKKEAEFLSNLSRHCNEGHRAKTMKMDEDENKIIRTLHLLSAKPILYIANVSEMEISSKTRSTLIQNLFDFAQKEGNNAVRICGQIEQEISTLPHEEKQTFLKEYGLEYPGLNKVIHASFDLLGLQTYFTGGPKEVRAWTINKGLTAPEAAGIIHTDFQRGFIKAEVYKFADLDRLDSEKAVRDRGLAKMEGKDYVVEEGDCIYFRFNV